MKKISKMKSSKLGNSTSVPAPPTISATVNGRPKGTGTTSAQDDTNLKVLRDLCHLEANRYCFECGQRGPNYVDVTIGSFICMQCSGLLRGLTPPHRVKSISMASFTNEEMDLLKSRGNEYCRKVWLATFTSKDTQLNSSDPDRINALKALMSSKYEQKRYYVDPARLPKGELIAIQGRNMSAMVTAVTGIQKSPSSIHSSPSPILNNGRTPILQEPKGRMINSATLPEIKPLTALDPRFALSSLNADLSTLSISSTSSCSSNTSTNRPHSSSMSGGHPPPIQFINNLSSTNGNHSFGSDSPWDTGTGSGKDEEFNPNFADFEDAFNNQSNGHDMVTTTPALPQKYTNGGFQPTLPSPLKPKGDTSSSSSNQNGFHFNGNGNHVESGEDKYAALKDLDSLFKQNPEAVSGTSPLQGSTGTGLTSSMSVPANLSSSVGQDWFSTISPPNTNNTTQNPFSQVNGNRWSNGHGLNNNSGHNPFYANGGDGHNGWVHSMEKSSTNGFSFASPPNGHHRPFGNYRPTPEPLGGKGGFNPFFTQNPNHQPLKTNPNNPFL